MFVKFRPSTHQDGIIGIKAAILQAATAPAGSDPTNPLTNYGSFVNRPVDNRNIR